MAIKVYRPKALTSGDLTEVINLGVSKIVLEEFQLKGKENLEVETGKSYDIVSTGSTYQVINPQGVTIAKILINRESGLTYTAKVNGSKDNAQGIKWRSSFYSSLKRIYEACLTEISNSCGTGIKSKEYLDKKAFNASWLALMTAIVVNNYVGHDSDTVNLLDIPEKTSPTVQDWEKAWDKVMADLIPILDGKTAGILAKTLINRAGDDAKKLEYLACLPANTIEGFGKKLQAVSFVRDESNLRNVTDLVDQDEDEELED